MDSLSPNLFVKDIRATIEFYKTLGFNLVMSVPATSSPAASNPATSNPTPETSGSVSSDNNTDLVWAMVSSGKVTFMFQTFQSLGDTLPMVSRQDGGSLLFYIKIQNIRSFFDSIKDNVKVVHGLQKTFYGATEFSITDPNNYLLTFAEDELE
jgi:uncharacterized glyoxalase superfamily protein PhnB